MKNELSLHSIPGSGISSSVVEVKAHRLASLRGGGFYFSSGQGSFSLCFHFFV